MAGFLLFLYTLLLGKSTIFNSYVKLPEGMVYGYCIWLVVLTILKNMKVNGKDDYPIYYAFLLLVYYIWLVVDLPLWKI